MTNPKRKRPAAKPREWWCLMPLGLLYGDESAAKADAAINEAKHQGMVCEIIRVREVPR